MANTLVAASNNQRMLMQLAGETDASRTKTMAIEGFGMTAIGYSKVDVENRTPQDKAFEVSVNIIYTSEQYTS